MLAANVADGIETREREGTMAVAAAVHGGYFPVTSNLSANRKLRQSPPPVFISTNPLHVIPHHLQSLYSLCNHSPGPSDNPVDSGKLRIALYHSDVVVSVFSHPEVVDYYRRGGGRNGGDWFWRVQPVAAASGELVGFGRAVSDYGLTAAIYDVMVLPPLQGMGIGQKIVKRILRVLTSRGIYDISTLCSGEERLFFKSCGFGNDIMESTTMIYTRTVSTYKNNEKVGPTKLLVPPDKKPLKSAPKFQC